MNYQYNGTNDYIKAKDKDNPLDTVSYIVWDIYRNTQDIAGLITAGWDACIRYYYLNTRNDELNKVWQIFLQHPIISCDIAPNSIVFAGLASGDVLAISISNNYVVHLGNHDAPICGVFWLQEFNCLMSLGFDQLIKFWSLECVNGIFLQLELKLPFKTYATNFDFPHLLICSIDSTFAILNLKTLPRVDIPNEYLKSNIYKFSKVNTCRINSSQHRGVIGTMDGRTLNFDYRDFQNFKVNYAFVSRSQKRQSGSPNYHGQINALDLGVHNYQTFCVIGGTYDCSLNNILKRTKGKILTSTNVPVTALRLHPSGRYIVYASGSDWLKGLTELYSLKKPRIHIAKIKIEELNDVTSSK